MAEKKEDVTKSLPGVGVQEKGLAIPASAKVSFASPAGTPQIQVTSPSTASLVVPKPILHTDKKVLSDDEGGRVKSKASTTVKLLTFNGLPALPSQDKVPESPKKLYLPETDEEFRQYRKTKALSPVVQTVLDKLIVSETTHASSFYAIVQRREKSRKSSLESVRAPAEADEAGSLGIKPKRKIWPPPMVKHKPDTGYSWFVLIAVFTIEFFYIGTMSAYGLVIRNTNLLLSTSYTGLSLVGFFHSLTYVITMFLILDQEEDNERQLVMAGSLIMSTMVLTSAFVNHYAFYIFSLGFCVGLGGAMVYCPACVSLQKFFHRRLILANVLASLGGSLGSIVMPIAVHFSLEVSFPKGLYFAGLVLIGTALGVPLICSIFLRPVSDEDVVAARFHNTGRRHTETSMNLAQTPETSLNSTMTPETSMSLTAGSSNNALEPVDFPADQRCSSNSHALATSRSSQMTLVDSGHTWADYDWHWSVCGDGFNRSLMRGMRHSLGAEGTILVNNMQPINQFSMQKASKETESLKCYDHKSLSITQTEAGFCSCVGVNHGLESQPILRLKHTELTDTSSQVKPLAVLSGPQTIFCISSQIKSIPHRGSWRSKFKDTNQNALTLPSPESQLKSESSWAPSTNLTKETASSSGVKTREVTQQSQGQKLARPSKLSKVKTDKIAEQSQGEKLAKLSTLHEVTAPQEGGHKTSNLSPTSVLSSNLIEPDRSLGSAVSGDSMRRLVASADVPGSLALPERQESQVRLNLVSQGFLTSFCPLF